MNYIEFIKPPPKISLVALFATALLLGCGGGTSNPAATEACPTSNSIVESDGATRLGLNVSRASGVAPLAVFFDASSTSSSLTDRPFHDIEYRWEFGDQGSRTWTYGAKAGTASRNEAMGPVAAHVFESAGTFPITVRAIDGTTEVSSYSCNITVTQTDVEFVGNKTVCVSASGNFTDCPSGAVQVTSSNATTAVSSNIGTGNKRILFRRGESFSASNVQINKNGPGLIGAFGSGAKPLLSNTTGSYVFNISSAATPEIEDWRILDIQMDGYGLGGNSAGVGGYGSMKNLLLSRLDIRNMHSGVVFSGSVLNGINSSNYTSPMWDGLFLTDNTVFQLNGTGATGGNGFYLTGWRMAVMGNNIDNNGGGEHGIRSEHSRFSVWQHNTTQRIARAHMTLRSADQNTSTLRAQLGSGLHYTEKLLASENHFIGGSSGHAFAGTGPTNGTSNGRAREQIWEKNLMIGGQGTNGFFNFTGSEITARNNLLLMHPLSSFFPLLVGAYDTATALAQGIIQPTNIWFYHNTVYYPNAEDAFFATVLIGDVLTNSELTYKNNLFYAPNLTLETQDDRDWIFNPNNTIIHRTPLNSNTLVTELHISPNFSATIPTTAAHLKPLAGSYVIGRGTDVKVWSDYFGNLITGSSRDLGAVAQ
jgi:hypothetical protein